MKFNLIVPELGDVVQITSDQWYVWDFEWRPMTLEEQLEYSKQ
jgi:hypothetical protein